MHNSLNCKNSSIQGRIFAMIDKDYRPAAGAQQQAMLQSGLSEDSNQPKR